MCYNGSFQIDNASRVFTCSIRLVDSRIVYSILIAIVSVPAGSKCRNRPCHRTNSSKDGESPEATATNTTT